MSNDKALTTLVPTSVERVLAEFAERNRKAMSGDSTAKKVRVTVHLKSGRELRGFPLAVGEARETVLLQLDTSMATADVSHVPFSSVEAVTVHSIFEL
ncbi:MAG: hypothetical protein K1X89_13315 [Myxococcaceae bacterium]|nr:hypothetical protein [Myxococcaceae bacterium]